MRIVQRVLCLAAIGAVLAGCSSQSGVGRGLDDTDDAGALAKLSIPLDLREFEVVNADGHRGVFLKLSRLPEAVEHSSQNDPPRIVLDILGPTGGEAPSESFPGQDRLVAQVSIERRAGILRVILDLQGDELPAYSVHQMADWIMIRLGSVQSSAVSPQPLQAIGMDGADRG